MNVERFVFTKPKATKHPVFIASPERQRKHRFHLHDCISILTEETIGTAFSLKYPKIKPERVTRNEVHVSLERRNKTAKGLQTGVLYVEV